MSYRVIFYKKRGGEKPVEEFINKLDKKTLAKITQYIELLATNGPFLKPPYIKKIDHDLFELRIKSKLVIRIFYTYKNNAYILVHIYIKKTQKTPAKELAIAIDRLNELI